MHTVDIDIHNMCWSYHHLGGGEKEREVANEMWGLETDHVTSVPLRPNT